MIKENNYKILLQKYPYLEINEDIKRELTFCKSKKGDLTAQLDGLYIHSKYDPVKEAEKIAKEQSTADLLILGGFGLGYQTEAIMKRFPSSIIVVYEPSINLFLEAMEVRNFTKILLNPRIFFLIGKDPESIKKFLNPKKTKKTSYIPINNRVKQDRINFDSVKEIVRLYLSRISINRNTLLKFGKLWVKNQSKNLPLMGYKEDISKIFGEFDKIPGIIISAGPSMELIIPYLKKIKEKFLILAVDTALKSLLEEDIEPDFVMSIDSQYWNARHLEGIKCEHSILIADSSVQPSALRNFKNRVYFTNSTFPIGKYFESVRKPFPIIASGGSVSTNIWDFALKLGLKEIFFIGQDLGFPGNITHYKNSYFEKNMLINSSKLNPLETQSYNYIYKGFPTTVTSNSGKTIVSDKKMSIYIDWFKEKLSLHNITNCFNLSPDGCAIPGMEYKSILDIITYKNSRNQINNITSKLKNRNNDYYLPQILKAAEDFRQNLQLIVELGECAFDLSIKIEKNYHKRININPDLNNLTKLDNKIVGFNHSQTLSFIIEPFITQITDSESGTALEGLLLSRQLYSKIVKTGKLHIKYIEHSIHLIKSQKLRQ